jgi:hypothetical protein
MLSIGADFVAGRVNAPDDIRAFLAHHLSP